MLGRAPTALTKHTAWPVLEAEVENKIERLEKLALAKTIGNPGAIPVEELHYLRGFVHGLRYILAVPTGAENRLEQYLRQQGVEVQ